MMNGIDSSNAPPSLTPAVLSSLTSQPAAAEWLLSHAQHHILHHQQQLLYWTSFHNELGAVRRAQHTAATLPSPATSPTATTTLISTPTPAPKNLFMHDLAARLGAGPPGRSRANSATGGEEAADATESPVDLDRSPSSLTHARRPGSKKNKRATHAAFKAQPGLNRSASEEGEAEALSDSMDAGKVENGEDEEKTIAVAMPVAMPVSDASKDNAAHTSSHATAASFASSSVSYVPIIQPSKGQVPPPVPKSASSISSSPVTSTPPSPSSAAMVAANRRPPPVPPGVKSGTNSGNSSQPSSPIVKAKPPVPPPVPAHDLAAVAMATPTVSPPVLSGSSDKAAAAFQPRSLPQAPQRGKGTPTTSTASTATGASLPPPVPELPVTSSNEDYLAAAVPLANAPPNADGTSAEATAPASSVGNRMGGMGGFKLPGAGGGDNSDLMAKLAKKREAADTPALPAAAATTTTTTTTITSANTSPISLKPTAIGTSAAPSAVVSSSVPPCGKCGCADFKQAAFQKGKCNNCFHQH